ncbi:hypothetical protein CR513_40134, partial [Mucuna pruriens]
MDGQQYFIRFIDNYFGYNYLYLIHEKSQSLDVFKSFKAKVDLQLGKKIKAINSNHGGEYYGRYDGLGEQRPGPFALFLRECGIVLQYIILSKPSMNGVQNDETKLLRMRKQPQQPQDVPLRRSIRKRRHAIPYDYIICIQEYEDGIVLIEDDLINFCRAMKSSNSQKWIDAMKDELKFMQAITFWDLVELPKGVKPIGCKWIFKTKKDFKGNIKIYKVRVVAKGFTQKEDIDYKDTFSSVSSKDSFRIVMALVAHFDLELHQMDVKVAFLNGDIDEMIYMVQLENFVSNKSKNPSVASNRLPINDITSSINFEENVVNDCVYHKFSGSKYIFLVLYIDDILLVSSDTCLLYETKRFFTKNFEMKDLGETSLVLGIQILRDCSQGILRLSQENYISKVLDRFDMKDSKLGDTPIAKGEKISLKQCPNNDLERNEMQKFPYVSTIVSLMYAQVCTYLDIAFVVGVWAGI